MSVDGSSLHGHRRSLSDLLATHMVKRPKYQSQDELQEAAVQLLNRHQNLSELLLEVRHGGDVGALNQHEVPKAPEGPFVVDALQREAAQLGVPVGVLSAKVLSERVWEVMGREEDTCDGGLLGSAQRAHLSILMESAQQLLILRAFSPQLFCQHLCNSLKPPVLEVLWRLHVGGVLSLEHILESQEGAVRWLGTGLKSLSGRKAEEDEEVQEQILSGVVSILVRTGFQESPGGKGSAVCCCLLDDMLSWVLDSLQVPPNRTTDEAPARWVRVLDPAARAASVSGEVLQRSCKRSLTHVLTYKPQFTVSDAITMQSDWRFAKTNGLLLTLYRKLTVPLGVEEIFTHLQQVLETHEVSWQHVLSFVSCLLVYCPAAQRCLAELLSHLLASAFQSYDLESMITTFLLARQGNSEGPAVFPSYSEWFRKSFGSATGYHGNSKKSLVFLLKFLSDLVPYEPPQYLKVHILYPPYVPVKHRTILQEYVSLARTRLTDMKVSVDDMGLYEDVSGATAPVQPQCQATQDVEKAVALYESTGKISAAVMEASIFRRPYFTSRFLPALLTPRMLPPKPDARVAFIEALRKAEKIPVTVYATYTQACEKERRRQLDGGEQLEPQQPPEQLQCELQELRALLTKDGMELEVSAQLSRISETLRALVPDGSDERIRQTAVRFNPIPEIIPELESKVIGAILRSFCQSLLDASGRHPPSRQCPWAGQFVRMLLGHHTLMVLLLQRLWDLLCHQEASLTGPHILGLAAFLAHLHEARAWSPPALIGPTHPELPMSCSEALGTTLPCSTANQMSFCLRFGVTAVCYSLCRAATAEALQEFVPGTLYKKLLYLIPRLLPVTREDPGCRVGDAGNAWDVWKSITDPSSCWESTVRSLWRQPSFQALQEVSGYQLSFTEWIEAELQVQRSTDVLADIERQEYQQWACQQLYLPALCEQGGCEGDVQRACRLILHTVLRSQTCLHGADTCLTDILTRLRELAYELEASRHVGNSRPGSFLLDGVLEDEADDTIAGQMELQRRLHTWNRVVLALPATLLVAVKTQSGRKSLDCSGFIKHVNIRQRNACVPAARLSCALTAHFLRGLLTASTQCDRPAWAVNEALAYAERECPLVLTSAAYWWSRLGPSLLSLWSRIGVDAVPERLQLLRECSTWASRLVCEKAPPLPQAPPLMLAACLYQAGSGRVIQSALDQLHQQQRALPVFLLFFCVTEHISSLLQTESDAVEATHVYQTRQLCVNILARLGDCSDWLMLFDSPGAEPGQYQAVAMVTTDMNTRLMPLAFYSILTHVDTETLLIVTKAPDFLLTALRCYSHLTKLFLEGGMLSIGRSPELGDVLQILGQARRFLLGTISKTSFASFSPSHLRQLQEACGPELDPEVSATLSSYTSTHCSQELDFL